MKRTLITLTLTLLGAAAAFADGLTYPDTLKSKQVDNLHGVEVADPYRWLEDDVRESAEVSEWVEAQNEVTFQYLESLAERDLIKTRLADLWNFEKYQVPFREGGRYFFFLNDGLQNQDVLYTQKTLDDEPEVLIDPNQWSDDGTVALSEVQVSRDGHYLAYEIQESGSDWRTWRVMDIGDRKILEDELHWLKFTNVSWDGGSEGFFYSRYPATDSGEEFQSLNMNQKVYYHRVGTDQAEDRLVYARADHPEWGFAAEVTEDGRYLVITIWKGTDDRYQIVYQNLEDPDAEPVTLIGNFDYDYTFVGSEADVLYFRTNNGAPKGRLIGIDIGEPNAANWIEVIPESDNVLRDASLVGDHFIAEYLSDARSTVDIYTKDGKYTRNVSLPGIGSAQGFEGKANNPETFYSFSSFNAPATIYRYDAKTGESAKLKEATVDFDPEDYAVKQVFYDSKDGTRVPMFIAYRKGIKRDGNNPTLLYGYGGFNISQLPAFSVTRLAWMEMGGVYAVANLRGGGEYGVDWHQGGTKLNKQNVFDDFIAAAEYLIEEDYTRPEKLSIFGRSNGGLLVGAVVNQRPELFGAALPAVGVMDMLRFQKFTAGRFWVDDYGSADDPEQFEALYAYSPYHNVRSGTEYPAILVTTADTDDRVVPGHSFKYIAALQEAQAGDQPVLIRIETRAGHGSGKPTEKIIEEYADQWAFLAEHLGMTLSEGYAERAPETRQTAVNE